MRVSYLITVAKYYNARNISHILRWRLVWTTSHISKVLHMNQTKQIGTTWWKFNNEDLEILRLLEIYQIPLHICCECIASHFCSADLDQTPQNKASDRGLHCLLTGISIRNKMKWKSTPETPKSGNGLVQLIRMDNVYLANMGYSQSLFQISPSVSETNSRTIEFFLQKQTYNRLMNSKLITEY